jgi:hypothetical protein
MSPPIPAEYTRGALYGLAAAHEEAIMAMPMINIESGNASAAPRCVASRAKRIWTVVLTFYQRVRDRDHLADLELDTRNDLRSDRVREEARKRFWQS